MAYDTAQTGLGDYAKTSRTFEEALTSKSMSTFGDFEQLIKGMKDATRQWTDTMAPVKKNIANTVLGNVIDKVCRHEMMEVYFTNSLLNMLDRVSANTISR